MNKELMEYKGYSGTVQTSLEDGVLHGSIQFINDKVNYEADTVPALKAEFEAAVDDYLETCKALNRSPNKPFSGTFQVRVNPDMHRDLALLGLKKDKSLNQLANIALGRLLTNYDPADQTLKAIQSFLPRRTSTKNINLSWDATYENYQYQHGNWRKATSVLENVVFVSTTHAGANFLSEKAIGSFPLDMREEERH